MASVDWNGNEVFAQIHRNAQAAVDGATILLQNNLKRTLSRKASNIGSGGTPSRPGEPPAKDTGAMSRSVQRDRSNIADRNPRVRVGTNVPYASVHEFGQRISAQGKALPVPFPGAERRARQLRRQAGGSLRNLPKGKLFPVKTRRGSVLLVEKTGGKNSEAWRPVFVLVKSVNIPPRPWFRPTIKASRKAMVRKFKQSRLLKGVQLG